MPALGVAKNARAVAITLGWGALTLQLFGCGGPPLADLATPTVSVSLLGIASDPAAVAIGESSGGLSVTQAYVRASSLSLVPCREGAAELVLSARGYDLLLQPPPSELVQTAVRELCALRLDVDPLTQNAIEGVPEGASVFVAGSDAAGEPFTFSSEQSWSLMMEPEAGASLGELPLLLAFDVSTWLAGLPLPDDTSTKAEMAAKAQKLFETQLRASAAVYVDENENGALDEEEATPVALAAPAR